MIGLLTHQTHGEARLCLCSIIAQVAFFLPFFLQYSRRRLQGPGTVDEFKVGREEGWGVHPFTLFSLPSLSVGSGHYFLKRHCGLVPYTAETR